MFGAGAIGGFLAARLEAAGTPVSVVARGPHLAAMQADGLVLDSGGERTTTRPRAVSDPAAIGPQDYVFLTLKAHSLEPALPQLRPLIGPETTVVAAVNGIPWWYCPREGEGPFAVTAAEIAAPGVISHTYGDRFSLGEPDGSRSARAETLSRLMIDAGLKAPVRPRLRDELWVKLWGNMAFNPLSALTIATLDVITGESGIRGVARAMMLEGQAVGEALGARFAIDVDKRIAGGAEVGRHKTSMLQDLELGRPLEIEAVLGAVVEMAGWVDVPMPISTAVLELTRTRAAMRGPGH